MKKLTLKLCLSILTVILMPLTAKAQSDFITLHGHVKDAVWNTELTETMVYMYDIQGNLLDSVSANLGAVIKDNETVQQSHFTFRVPRKEATYTFDATCPGYTTATVTYTIEKLSGRESFRDLPVILLQKAPHKLGEVTVTASKIKFYHKGDTLVYNASAFQLAEGSMLDALISQLPGAELNDDGQIKVNGEFVESLLLNGKKLFDGNKQLMLENIGAYTVKSVEVYKGQTREEKWIDDPMAEKHLTMDVKLKKEYLGGLLVNAQGGYGTENRYMGRLFASLFTPTLNLALAANFNNLNDNRKPGKSDTWSPEMMPSGTRRYNMAGLNYDYTSRDDRTHAEGELVFEETGTNERVTTARTNFLNGGNTYENSFSHRKTSNLKLETRNTASINNDRYYLWSMLLGRYIRKDNRQSMLSASFREEQADITAEAIEAIYSSASPDLLDAVINRAITRSDANSHEGEFQFYPEIRYKIPGTNDYLRFQAGVKYRDAKEEVWRDYNINYGADPTPAVTRRQYIDNSPNRRLTLDGTLDYNHRVNRHLSLGLLYSYRFENTDKDSYMYALDRLADMGIYGTLPAGYLSVPDLSNTYTSRLMQNVHSIKPSISYNFNTSNANYMVRVRPELAFEHRHMDYWRDGRSYLVKRSSRMLTAKNLDVSLWMEFDPKQQQGRRTAYRHTVQYMFNVTTKLPDMLHMVDVVDDSDPLNISAGNPGLGNEYQLKHSLSWLYKPHTQYINNKLRFTAMTTDNALVRGYTYNTLTGVRRNRTYNVDGNNSYSADNNLSWQFGRRQQFTLTSTTSGSLMNYADMIGVDLEEPEKSKVRTAMVSQKLRLDWQIGRQRVSLLCQGSSRHTSSTREDFNVINARHFSYGTLCTFALPAGFGIDTGLMFYTRRGYGVSHLDTTEAVWNMRLIYTPRGGRWVFMADGFDLLHQLSNVNYAVNASGRTVSYSNALPRYVMLSVQYRLNIQPKKR